MRPTALPDGRWIAYVTDEEGMLMAARLRTEPILGVVGCDTLFINGIVPSANSHANVDASADGAHRFVLKPARQSEMTVVPLCGASLRARMFGKSGG